MKQLLSLILAVVMVISLSACSNSQNPVSTSSTTTSTENSTPATSESTTTTPTSTITEPTTESTTESGPEPEPEPEPEPKPDLNPDLGPKPEPIPGAVEITMSFVGDCTFGRNHKAAYSNSFDECYDKYGPDYFFANVLDIFEADDITVINLEGPLTTSNDIQTKTWNHKGDPAYVEIMTRSSIEVAGMANNHRLDYGQSGSDETEQVLTDAGVTYCFDGKYAIYEVKGVRIGIVSINALQGTVVEKWLKNGHKYLREQGCVVVAAMVHWGLDKKTELSSYQESLAPRIIDMGYDVVVGHHPHILQGIQEYKGKYICYSLGNFCYGGSKNPADKDSGIFQQTFTVVDGELQDSQAQFIPCYLSSVSSRNDYRPTLAVGAEAQRIIDKINSYSKVFGLELDSEGNPIEEDT